MGSVWVRSALLRIVTVRYGSGQVVARIQTGAQFIQRQHRLADFAILALTFDFENHLIDVHGSSLRFLRND